MADRPFLSRWARLKQESRQTGGEKSGERQSGGRGGAAPVLEEPTRQAALPPEAGDQDHSVPAQPSQPGQERVREQDAAIDPSELPDIDSLTAESDFTAFMRKGVPKTLQRKALRKLWASDPVLACLDGLNDYEEDFTDAATVIEGMKSSYQVGRGFLTDAELAENHSVYDASRQARIEADEKAEAEETATAETGPAEDTAEDTASIAEGAEPEQLPESAAEDLERAEPGTESGDSENATEAAEIQPVPDAKNKNDNHS
ncbi:DUF3306 domain-containing protein [Oceanibaculum nanhaiense]|uniref:DUF3306 domain-containing protein n=1 Tax=Oceanibaculum nanhaiense TaxID=1909734 RepID=UPI003F703588